MNSAMSPILTLWALLDAHQWRLISDTETALHQNEAKATKTIKVVKAYYMATICEAEDLHVMAIREAETNCSTSIMEAEGGHVTAIREVEAACVAHALDLQQTHGETIWALENEAIKEDRWAHQSFLQACRVALWTCPVEALGVLMYPIQLLTGNMSLTGLLMATPQQTINLRGPIPSPSCCKRLTMAVPCSKRPTMAAHSMGTKWPHSSPGHDMGLDWSREKPTSCPKEPPQWRWKEGDPLEGCPEGAHQEAFRKDSNLVKWIRKTYFRAPHPQFDSETTHDLTHVFKEMVDVVSLLNTEVHQVQDPWPGKKELHAANHAAISSAKDICYFQVVSPMESPKIMGLKGIHFPEALRHQGGLAFCPWCGKEGQNEGTVVNHLCTGHYCLGLICKRCLLFFTTNSNTM